MKRLLLIGLLPLLLLAQAKVGQSGAKFLSIGMSPRAMGLGEAYVAVANDASSVFWNPAGIANIKGKRLFIAGTEWLVDTHLPALSYVGDLGKYGKFSVFMSGVYSPGFKEVILKETGETVITGNELTYSGLQAGFSYARYFTDKFAVGVLIKGVYENFGDVSSAYTVAMDAGTYFHTGWQSLRIAMSLQNLGPDMKLSGDYHLYLAEGGEIVKEKRNYYPYPLPMIFRLGAAMEVLKNELHRVTASVEAVHPNDNEERISLGFEYSFAELFFLRGGYTFNKDEGGFAFGVGFAPHKISLDYSFTDFGGLPDIHRVGITMGF